jgi:bifunctional UDP-N-acetylglucosamine pyrophosphorylase/glucosamine-1-phosphate N-acetyltransferase
MNTTVVILAAGLGTRMRSKRAKVLHRAGGRALVESVVAAARTLAPPERIVVVTGHQAEQVEDLLAPQGVRFVRQQGQNGTGHALASCRDAVEHVGLLMVLYGDTPLLSAATLARLRETQASSAAAASLITTELADPTGYGRVICDAEGNVSAIVEEKACTPEQRKIQLINSGIYCFDSALLWKHIGEIGTNNPAGEYYLTDMAEILARHGHFVRPMQVMDSAELLGINTRLELSDADRLLRRRKTEELMLSGVTIENPETVSIDAMVTVGQDTIIEPFARLLGSTVVGDDCRIGAGAILENSTLETNVTIAPYTLVSDSTIKSKAYVGPFARLRMHAEVGEAAHVGNFVELKKTSLGEGAKSQHLAYLGDSEIGARCNIGAGTITCNYDGDSKHQTKIGEDAFIGSNSTLVAPLEIGAKAYIGAGSVITDPVPPNALALGRGRQFVKEGWKKKPRK